MIPFTGFEPDNDPTMPGIIKDCTNLIPTLRGYAGGASGADVGMNALAAAALSGAVMTKLDLANRLIVGTLTKLYEKSGTSWSDVSRAAVYNASTTYPWRFAQFGDTSLAANKGDVIQYSSSGAFANLTAPKAALICTVSGFVMVANTNDATYGDSQNRWWCSAFLNHTDWVPAIATQCTTGLLVDTAGPITALRALGDAVVAYKNTSMYIARYSGPPGVWDFDLIPGEIGCTSQESVLDIGTAHIFIGKEDFYLFDGSRPVSIGSPLRKWFFADIDPAYTEKIRTAHDKTNSLAYFFYPRVGGSGAINGCVVYNYKTNKWGLSHRTIEATVDYVTGGYTWDTLPITTWDSWPEVAYDSSFWTSSTRYIAYIGTDHKIYSLTGSSTSSSLTTGDYGTEDQYTLLDRITVKYLDAPTTATLTNYYQEIHGGAWTEDSTTTESNGRFDLFRSAPWQYVKFDFTGEVEIVGASSRFKQDGVL